MLLFKDFCGESNDEFVGVAMRLLPFPADLILLDGLTGGCGWEKISPYFVGEEL